MATTYVAHERLIGAMQGAVGCLGSTDKILQTDGSYNFDRHVLLIWPEETGYRFWNPLKTGGAQEGFQPWKIWYEQRMWGTVLYRIPEGG